MTKETKFTLLLIRHAETERNVHHAEVLGGRSRHTLLTDHGTRQALALSARVLNEGWHIEQIFTSPLDRAIKTAAIAFPDHIATVVPELTEVDQGKWEGLSRPDTYTPKQVVKIKALGYFFTPPGGESQRDVQERVVNWIEKEFIKQDKRGKYVLVTHGIAIKAFLQYVLHFDEKFIYTLPADNTSITEVSFGSDGWVLERFNDSAHLRGL